MKNAITENDEGMSAHDLLYEPLAPPEETRPFEVGDVIELSGHSWLICSIHSTHIVVWGDTPPRCMALDPVLIALNRTYKWLLHASDEEMEQFKRMGAPL